MTRSKMVPLRIPEDLLKSIDELVGAGGRTRFILEAAQQELLRRKQRDALDRSAGAWQDSDHPELPSTVEGLTEHLRKQRRDAVRRVESSPYHLQPEGL